MALDFPSNPQIDDEYTAANTTWKWDGTVWIRLGVEGPAGESVSNLQVVYLSQVYN